MFRPSPFDFGLLFLLFIALIFATIGFSVVACPVKSEIPNCECTTTNENWLQVFCSNLTDMGSLKNQMSQFEGQNVSVLLLKNLSLPYLPSGLFKGMIIRSIEISFGQFHSLGHPSNIGSPFDGLEEHLTSFQAFKVERLELLDFTVFGSLNILNTLDFQFTNITKFEGWLSLFKMTKLRLFTVSDSNLTTLETNALASHKNIEMVIMILNKIEALRRDFFPNPAPRLKDLMFGSNKISFIPENIFENMPELKYVDLSDNQLSTVSQYWFQPVFSGLLGMQIRGNPLHCDKALYWYTNLVQMKNAFHFEDFRFSKCFSPPRLANRTVVSLSQSELEDDHVLVDNSLNN